MAAERTDQPSESVTPFESHVYKPLSNAEEYPLALTGNDLSRMSSNAGIATTDGFAPARDGEEYNEDEDSEGDYVALSPEEKSDLSYWFRQQPARQHSKLDELHPFVQTLNLSNVDDCVKVESAFPESERCSREKFLYRLTKCPELSLGLFTMPVLKEGQPKPQPTLIAHVIATRTSAPRVTDRSMQLPSDWRAERESFENGQLIGHEEYGRTVAVHSLAVLPEQQGKHVGSTLMKSYIQRIKEAGIADSIAIIAHEHLIPFYAALGFENKGPSACQFAGGGWVDLVRSL